MGKHAGEFVEPAFPVSVVDFGALRTDPPSTAFPSGRPGQTAVFGALVDPPVGGFPAFSPLYQIGRESGSTVIAVAAPLDGNFKFKPGLYDLFLSWNTSFGSKVLRLFLSPADLTRTKFLGANGVGAANVFLGTQGANSGNHWRARLFFTEEWCAMISNDSALVDADVWTFQGSFTCRLPVDQVGADIQPTESR